MKRKNFPARKELRQQEAVERQEAYSKLTAIQKLRRLNADLGKDTGAKKERRKLETLIKKEKS